MSLTWSYNGCLNSHEKLLECAALIMNLINKLLVLVKQQIAICLKIGATYYERPLTNSSCTMLRLFLVFRSNYQYKCWFNHPYN